MSILLLIVQALLLGATVNDAFNTISEEPDSVIQSELFYLEFYSDHIYSEEKNTSRPYADLEPKPISELESFRIRLNIPKGLQAYWKGDEWTAFLFNDNSEIYIYHFFSDANHNEPPRYLCVYDAHRCNRNETDSFYYTLSYRARFFFREGSLRPGHSLYIVRGDVADIYIMAKRCDIKRILTIILSGCQVVELGQEVIIGRPL